MALTFECDYCGGEIENRAVATLKTGGWHELSGLSSIGIVQVETFHFHAGADDDESSCYRRALDALRLSLFGEQVTDGMGLEWRLMPIGEDVSPTPERGSKTPAPAAYPTSAEPIEDGAWPYPNRILLAAKDCGIEDLAGHLKTNVTAVGKWARGASIDENGRLQGISDEWAERLCLTLKIDRAELFAPPERVGEKILA